MCFDGWVCFHRPYMSVNGRFVCNAWATSNYIPVVRYVRAVQSDGIKK
jgi:hypothetical protein